MLLAYKAVLIVANRRHERTLFAVSQDRAVAMATRLAERLGGDFTSVLACELHDGAGAS